MGALGGHAIRTVGRALQVRFAASVTYVAFRIGGTSLLLRRRRSRWLRRVWGRADSTPIRAHAALRPVLVQIGADDWWVRVCHVAPSLRVYAFCPAITLIDAISVCAAAARRVEDVTMQGLSETVAGTGKRHAGEDEQREHDRVHDVDCFCGGSQVSGGKK